MRLYQGYPLQGLQTASAVKPNRPPRSQTQCYTYEAVPPPGFAMISITNIALNGALSDERSHALRAARMTGERPESPAGLIRASISNTKLHVCCITRVFSLSHPRTLRRSARISPLRLGNTLAYFDEGLGLPVVLRGADVAAVLRDSETFSTRAYDIGIVKGTIAALSGESHMCMRRLFNAFLSPRVISRCEETIVTPVAAQGHGTARAEGAGGPPRRFCDVDAHGRDERPLRASESESATMTC